MPTRSSGSSARIEPKKPAGDRPNAKARWRRGLVSLLLASFACDFAVSVLTLAMQFLGIKLKASPMLLGLYGTVGSGIYGAMALIAGRVSDRFGRRLAAGAVFVTAGVWVVIGLQTSPYMLLLVAPISSASLAFFWPPVQAWIGDLVRDRDLLNRVLGSFNVLWTTGLMLGPVACGYLWEYQHLAPFLAAAGVGVGIAALLMFVPMRTRRAAATKVSVPTTSVPEGAVAPASTLAAGESAAEEEEEEEGLDARADYYLPLAWAANFVSWAAVGVVRSLFPKLADGMGFSEVLTGWLTFAYYVGQLFAFIGLRQMTGWRYRRLPLVVGLVGGGLGMAGAWLGRSPLIFALSFGVAGLSVGFTYVASLYYSLHAPAELRGRRAGIHEMTVGAGGALGPLVGGVVATYYGVRSSFGAIALMFAVASVALVVWSLVRRPRVVLETAERAPDTEAEA